MTLLMDFKARLGKLTATKKLDADLLEIFIEDAVTEFSRHNPEHVKLKKVPTTRENNGYYDVPSDATSVVKVLVHDTDIEIEFSMEKDSQTHVSQIRLGAIVRPSTYHIEGHHDPVVNYNLSPNSSRYGISEGYDAFDIEFLRNVDIERLSRQDLRTVQLYVEYLGYLEEASKTENLVDITDRDSSGDATTLRRSNIGKQWGSQAELKKEAFMQRAIRPYGSRTHTRNFEYYYGEI